MAATFPCVNRLNLRCVAFGFLILAAAGALAAGGVYLLVRDKKDEFLASRLAYLSAVADLKAANIRAFQRERTSDLLFYSTDAHLTEEYRGLLRGAPSRTNDAASVLGALLSRGLYSSVSLVDRRGRSVLLLPPDAEAISPGPGPAGAPRLLGMRRDAAGRPALDYEAGTADGARLLLRIYDVPWLDGTLERWPGAERSAEAVIFQRDEDVLRPLTTPRLAGPGADVSIPRDGDDLAARAARGEKGPFLGRDYRGEVCYAVSREFPDLGWFLVVKADEKELLAPLREKLFFHLLAASGIGSLLVVLALMFFRAQADRLRAEADAERRLLAAAIEQAGESVVITDRDARIIYTNPAFSAATGYTRDEARGKNPSILKSGRHDAAFYVALWKTLTRGEPWNGRMINRRKDGSLFEEDASITPVRGEDGEVTHYIAVKRDVTAVKSLEDQLFHSQKMEAIGRLAGGVAHDFNNILTTINGYAEMLADAAPPSSQTSSDLAEILGAGRRAALLTRQLLTFSRRAPADPIVVDLRALVRSIEKMLRRTLGEDIRLALDVAEEPLWVRADPGQIDQVLMNLAVNARDAMPRGGTLTVGARPAELAEDAVRSLAVIPAGRYAVLSVADEGEGMDERVLSRIFEPFFTTKEKGKGTGLGLATVFGIVKQNRGYITVDSAPGRGSLFTVHLPLTGAPTGPAAPSAPPTAASARGDETVLVVEDQSEVLRLVSRALTPQGYRVIPCGGGAEALEAARTFSGPIHLLLTDVVMPGMNGEELAAAVRGLRPGTRVLYMSGYTDGRLDGLIESGGRADLLLKPFTADQVCRRVREALDGAAPRVA